MLDNGFSLARIELLNWGNFHGYQKFSLYEPMSDGPLFNLAPASAILGVNGSGKSTLIDALMIVLLPFEGSVKLGVTNDVEAGSGGGRTIRDYVLGKHSSHSGVISDPAAIFGRKEGCSIVLLNFVHNKNPQRHLTLGRAWWYQNYKVSETQVAFLAHQKVSIQDLCSEAKTPPTAKVFRQNIKSAIPNIQPFETMQNYFTAASQALGKISRDDLKILNRTFFVKSISNIDQFIRENMLVEQESPNLERLMENVKNGQEIAFSIETCEAKIAAISRILRELNKLAEFTEAGHLAERRLRLLSLYREWSEWRDLLRQKETLEAEGAALRARMPLLKTDADRAHEQWRTAEARLLSDDIEVRLAALDQGVQSLEEKILWKRKTFDRWAERATALKLQLPKNAKGWSTFLVDLPEQIKADQGEVEGLATEIENLRERRYALEAIEKEKREALDHITQTGTLIPRELHSLRDLALHKLNIPVGHLLFVGELLQVKQEARHLRTAVESALFPIARNLLCHPDSLQVLTRWLDSEGLRADVTVKRIVASELETQKNEFVAREGSILRTTEMKPADRHPFSSYLWRWLNETFDYEVVDVKRFKSEHGKLVTIEGLVKEDQRTMRKLRRGFAFSLGWDNSERIEELSLELVQLQNEHTALRNGLEAKLKSQTQKEDQIRLLVEVGEGIKEVIGIDDDEKQIGALKSERSQLLERNPNHRELRLQVDELAKKAKGLARSLLEAETDFSVQEKVLVKVSGLIPVRENELKGSKLYMDLIDSLKGEVELQAALDEIHATLERRGVTRLQLESESADEARRAEHGRGRAISTAAVNLGNYRHNFNDPNLPYDLGADFELAAFLRAWSTAEKHLHDTELPGAQEKWKKFFDQVLMDSVKDMINEIKSRVHEVSETVISINEVLKLTNFEDLVTEQRYLRIEAQTSVDERIRKFRKSMGDVEKTLGPAIRSRIESNSQEIMVTLAEFVDEFQKDPAYRAFVTDVRHHFQFAVQSLRRGGLSSDEVVEVFSGSRKDAKSSAQTTQLAYALLASCLAYRFHFHDPVAGADTPRLIVFDEFGGKFDNEKPRDILSLLDKMGFQSVLVSPMSKADLLADGISHLVLVHKVSASRSKVQSYLLNSRQDYDRLLTAAQKNSVMEEQAFV